MRTIARSAVTTLAVTAGLGLAGLGTAIDAQAQPGPFADYHWCSGQFYDAAWGPNWDVNECHSDVRLVRDGDDDGGDFPGYDDQQSGPDEPEQQPFDRSKPDEGLEGPDPH